MATHPLVQSRSHATQLISSGNVVHDLKSIKPSTVVRPGEKFHVTLELTHEHELVPYNFPIDIVFEDADVLVVNKPSGLVVHPAAGHFKDTLINALIHHEIDLSSGFHTGRPGLVHRIDKDTSGLLVIAKNDTSHRFLAQQFKAKSTHRVYWAITYGKPLKKSGTIQSSLSRHPKNRKIFASIPGATEQTNKGKWAITHYEVIKSNDFFSLLHCRLETGRTHQIRVHLSEMKTPIVGDPLYGRTHKKNPVKKLSIPHLLLHAAELGFVHPKTKKKIYFKADWPIETHNFLSDQGFL